MPNPFDPDKLQAKYLAEREARSKNGGISQYRPVQEKGLERYLADGNAPTPIHREPISSEHEVVIVGGGYAAMMVAIQLSEQGIHDFLILDEGGDFGGTWYWNRYPGAQCDVESYIYMPFLEQTGYIPTEKYSHAPEIFSHAQRIGRKFDLYARAVFQTHVQSVRWQDVHGVWAVETDRGDRISARWTVLCPGNQSKPKLPGLSGIEAFKGISFHTSRWDYTYTGGNNEGHLDKLSDRRIGIIGTGASAVQVLPKLAQYAQHVYVLQRTPSSISVRNNEPTNASWASSLKAGWQRERMDNFHALTSGLGKAGMEDLVNDAWTQLLPRIAGAMGSTEETNEKTEEKTDEETTQQSPEQLADFQIMESIRERVDREVVRDPDTAAALKPWYNFLCKRPCFHDEYLQAFNRENVTLVDTRGKGVEAVTENGVTANGQEIELDCIVYATGFEWQTEWVQRTGMQVYGRDGVTISEKWKDGISTFHGWGVSAFPNLLLVTHAQSGLSVNYTHSALNKASHIAYIIKTCLDRGIRTVEPTEEEERKWVDGCVALGESRKQFLARCIPGYLNNEGTVDDKVTRSNPYPGGPVAYENTLRQWRDEGKLQGLQLR